MAKETAVEVKIEDRVLKLTNLEKVLYPEVGFTKGQVIDYYTRIAATIEQRPDECRTARRQVEAVLSLESLL